MTDNHRKRSQSVGGRPVGQRPITRSRSASMGSQPSMTTPDDIGYESNLKRFHRDQNRQEYDMNLKRVSRLRKGTEVPESPYQSRRESMLDRMRSERSHLPRKQQFPPMHSTLSNWSESDLNRRREARDRHQSEVMQRPITPLSAQQRMERRGVLSSFRPQPAFREPISSTQSNPYNEYLPQERRAPQRPKTFNDDTDWQRLRDRDLSRGLYEHRTRYDKNIAPGHYEHDVIQRAYQPMAQRNQSIREGMNRGIVNRNLEEARGVRHDINRDERRRDKTRRSVPTQLGERDHDLTQSPIAEATPNAEKWTDFDYMTLD